MAYDADVIVIGAGPVGTVALALLGRLGVAAIGLEKDVEMWTTARAVHFDGETFRTLQALGIADEVRAVTIPMKDVDIVNTDGEVLVHAETHEIGGQGWNEHISFHQPDVEALVRRVVESAPGISLRRGVTVTEVRNVEGGVEVATEDDGGARSVLTARWAIAADGARGQFRRALGIETDKYGEDEQWLVVDGHLVGAPGYQTDMIQFASYLRPALWLRLPGTRVRMEFMLVPGDDPDHVATPEAVELMSAGILPRDKFTPDRQAIYTFRGRIAQRWRDGNIFIAGDAAHQAPPLFGQGLCAGLRDVANLVWKLDLVRRGLAGDELLDTYESERKPHATYWVEVAANQAVAIQTLDPHLAQGRDEFMKAHPEASAVPIPPSLGPGLHDGDRDGRAGRLSIQPIRSDGTRLDDEVGPRFVVAAERSLYEQLPDEVKAVLDEDSDTVTLLEPVDAGVLLASVDAQAVVIRPDHYILGCADTVADLEGLVRRIPSIAHLSAPLHR
ncbi:bifunctional 3-(3-hydroxy-phenyl)propionate/3-hydroxycinnamic acid hydroxylase [Actinoplanes subtropicus]|uniref:bifunctional 3-(3-hydroxy-phenyl)propionate/3-hydroxycinnamic acid hydroxylase n=1 Tax=Actinoplanes subtropicus TaxID=543632 RepID=UPI0004C2EF47|nr:bifunctional 3-(3-hydroxy-phenyl)propionate/3-hydroxycinnamic acid hydroxylase [Actinoplanes subtropicus]